MPSNETMNVIHACAAGLDVHKMQITATVLVALADTKPRSATKTFSALPSSLRALVGWLADQEVKAAVLEATGIYWEAPYEALEEAGIEPILVQAQHVKQIKGRKTDVADSIWLARICQFGLGCPSMIPPPLFRRLRKVSRLRRQLIRDRASLRNRIHKILDAVGPPHRRRALGCVRRQRHADPGRHRRRESAGRRSRAPSRRMSAAASGTCATP